MSRVRVSFPAPTKNPRRFILNNSLLCTFSFGNAYNKATIDINNRRYSQVVRHRSAKPSSPGSNPGDASKISPCRNLRHRSFFIRFFRLSSPTLFRPLQKTTLRHKKKSGLSACSKPESPDDSDYIALSSQKFIFHLPCNGVNILSEVMPAIRAILKQPAVSDGMKRHVTIRATPYKMCDNIRYYHDPYSEQNTYEERNFKQKIHQQRHNRRKHITADIHYACNDDFCTHT